ncbi:MAG: hypothetical protein COB15_11385 [Flavobacteriales bacterium]|nr:MAG: hypothetical protein COB15_11385 [Flavobacteriales bacterium]
MKGFITKYACLVFFLFAQYVLVNSLNAQTKFSDGLKIESNYHQGNIIPEFGLLDPIEEDYRRSIEFNLFKKGRNDNYWAQIYNYPEHGLSFFYTSLGHDEVLGRAIGIDYFFRINFFEIKNLKIFNQTGFGINYVNRKLDSISNPYNIAISSYFNFHFNLRLGGTYYLAENYGINIGLSFDHISNANLSHPNIGVNSISLFGGVVYDVGSNREKELFLIPAHQSKTTIDLITELGWMHLDKPRDKYYFTPSISLDLSHETFRLIHFGIGTDFFYDETIKVDYENQSKDFQSFNSLLGGIHLSQSIVYDKFRFILQEGYYLVLPEELDKQKQYHRVLFKYYLKQNISTHLSFKTYLQDLKYVSLGFGYKIK